MMNNLNSFRGNKKLENLYGNNKELIWKLDNYLKKEPKQYYQICLDQEIPKELIFKIKGLIV